MKQGETETEFHARVEVELNALTDEYIAWMKANGLNLGSADEHLFDEDLTATQRTWLHDFSNRWENTNSVLRISDHGDRWFQRKEDL